MAYKTKTYVAFDGDSEMNYYNTLKMWDKNNRIDFELHNAHDLKQARDSSSDESIKRSLRDRIRASKIVILIVGPQTHHHTRFVKYEIEYAKLLGLPIVLAVLGNGVKPSSWFEDYPAIEVPFNLARINYALKNWPEGSKGHKVKGDVGIWHYESDFR